MLAKLTELNPKGPYLNLEKEKGQETCCVVFTYSAKPAREIEKVSCRSHATMAKLLFD